MKLSLGSLIKQLKNIPLPTCPGEIKQVVLNPPRPEIPTSYTDGTQSCQAAGRIVTLQAVLTDGILYWVIEF